MTDRKRVAIVQSCYIPWKGYFDMIDEVDEFVLLDDVQYTKRDWRNRNVIKTTSGLRWLTIPVETKGRYYQRIDETVISDSKWRHKHWNALAQTYTGAPFFAEYGDAVAELYSGASDCFLSVVNRGLLEGVCRLLGISTKLTRSTDYAVEGVRTERLVNICRATGATVYVSGPRARAYLEEERFHEAGIAVEYMDYSSYREYPQLYPPFDHAVTILDLIFSTGAAAPRFMKSCARSKTSV
jgi:WbqC-like protein family